MASKIDMNRRRSISIAILLLCMSALINSLAAPPLPNPKLVFTGVQNYVANGQRWVRYNLRVVNFAAYPNYLFTPVRPIKTWVTHLADQLWNPSPRPNVDCAR